MLKHSILICHEKVYQSRERLIVHCPHLLASSRMPLSPAIPIDDYLCDLSAP